MSHKLDSVHLPLDGVRSFVLVTVDLDVGHALRPTAVPPWLISPPPTRFVATTERCPICTEALGRPDVRPLGRVLRVIKQLGATEAGDRLMEVIYDPLPPNLDALACFSCRVWWFPPRAPDDELEV